MHKYILENANSNHEQKRELVVFHYHKTTYENQWMRRDTRIPIEGSLYPQFRQQVNFYRLIRGGNTRRHQGPRVLHLLGCQTFYANVIEY